MLPNLSKPSSQKPTYLTVPSTNSASGGGASGSGQSGTGGMIRNAFNRLVSGNWLVITVERHVKTIMSMNNLNVNIKFYTFFNLSITHDA